MRQAQNNQFTLNLGIAPYEQSYVFSVDGRAGKAFPDIVVTHQPYQGMDATQPAPRSTHLRFDGKAYVADNPEVVEGLATGIPQAAYLSYMTGVMDGAAATQKQIAVETYTQDNFTPSRRKDWTPTGSCVSIDVAMQGHWEIHGMKTTEAPSQLLARIITPAGLPIDAQIDAKGKLHFSADTPAHSITLPNIVHHAVYAAAAGQQAGAVHVLDNQREGVVVAPKDVAARQEAVADSAAISAPKVEGNWTSRLQDADGKAQGYSR